MAKCVSVTSNLRVQSVSEWERRLNRDRIRRVTLETAWRPFDEAVFGRACHDLYGRPYIRIPVSDIDAARITSEVSQQLGSYFPPAIIMRPIIDRGCLTVWVTSDTIIADKSHQPAEGVAYRVALTILLWTNEHMTDTHWVGGYKFVCTDLHISHSV